MDNNFIDWLLEEMNKREWTQAELARASGLTRQSVSDYINRRRTNPEPDALAAIAHALKLPADFVFEKAGLLPAKSELSPVKRKLLHLAEGLPDSDVEIAVALLEQRESVYKKNPQPKPAK